MTPHMKHGNGNAGKHLPGEWGGPIQIDGT